jgi:hypothetical protein
MISSLACVTGAPSQLIFTLAEALAVLLPKVLLCLRCPGDAQPVIARLDTTSWTLAHGRNVQYRCHVCLELVFDLANNTLTARPEERRCDMEQTAKDVKAVRTGRERARDQSQKWLAS